MPRSWAGFRPGSEQEAIDDLASSIVEGVLILPMGALAYVAGGWAVVALWCVGWIVMAIVRAAFAYRWVNRSAS